MTETLNRRNFLFYSGAGIAGITLGEYGRRLLAKADDRAATWRAATTERWTVSVCRECPAACGLTVRVVNGTPVKLEGNPRCPISRGRLCAKGQASIEALLDPDRLVGPAKRVGARGEGRWAPIPWDDAHALLAARLSERAGRPGEMLALAADSRGPVADAWSAFWTASGARLAWTPTGTASQLRDRFTAITGVDADPHFDVEHATYVLSAGAPLVETWLSPLWAQRAYGRFRRGSGRSRGRLVQLDDRQSMTSRKADEWIVVDADRQPALIYGVMAVLLRENRIDRGALVGIAGNLDDFERTVVARFTPDEVAAETGVPVVTILRLARDLVATPQPLAIVGADAAPALVDAVMALNSLIGAFDRPGGVLASLPAIESAAQAVPAPGANAPAGATPSLIALGDASALRALPTLARTRDALAKADFVVSFSPFLDETSDAADLLMPAHTSLESWHAIAPAVCVPGQALAIAAPVVQPRLDTMDLMAMLKKAATSAGGAVLAACPWNSTEDLAEASLGRLATAQRGGPYTTSYESDWTLQLERGGWWTSPVASRDDFPKAVLAAGGWADPFFEPGQVRRSLHDRGGPRFTPPPVMASPAAMERAADFPIALRAFTPAVVNLLGSPNQPALFELLGQPEGAPWRRWLELNPETARKAGLTAGATVLIASAQGTIEASAVLVDGMPADSAALSFVPSVPHGGRWAQMMSGDLHRLWPAGVDLSATVAVRVRPA